MPHEKNNYSNIQTTTLLLFGYLLLIAITNVSAVAVTNIYPNNITFNISSVIEINATITDSDGISAARVNITYPNGTIKEKTLTAQTGNKYNTTFRFPELPGDYTITVWANDTLSNSETNTSNTTAIFTNPTNIPGLLLWVDATDNTTLYKDSSCTTLVSAHNDKVFCWRDKSGNQNITVLSGKDGPRYNANASERISGSTFLRFNKSNETVYETGIDIRANTTEDVTIFTVYRPQTTDVTDQGQAIWGNDDGSWDRFYYSLFAYNAGLGTDGVDDGLISLGGASSGLVVDKAGLVNTIFLLTAIYDGNVSGGTNVGPTDASQIYFDGVLQVAFTDESHATSAQTQMFIGRDGDNGYYDGDVAELIIYNKTLNACELEIVNKHLSEEYGKDFFNITSNYGFAAPHNNSIGGIAEVDGNCTATVEITTAESDIVTIKEPTNLDLNDSLTIANDNGGNVVFTESPAGYESRLNQTWRVDEDNEVGNITVIFDLEATTISTTSSDFALIIDTTDTNFTDASIHTTGYTVSGRTVTFTNVNFSNGDYFTLAVTENFDDPTSLTNLRAWYDATDNTTLYTDESCSTLVTAAGDDVRCWEDKSSYKANASNVSGKGIPTYITGEFNSLSVLNFSKSEQDTIRHTVPSEYTANFTVFTVIQSKGNAATFDSFFSNGEPADTNHFQIDYTNDSGSNSFRYGSSTKFLFENYSNEIRLYSVTHDGSDIVLYNEGSQVNTGSTTEGQVFEHYRINQNRNGNQHHDSKIAEIIIYDRVLTTCELEKVNIYLGQKYGRDFFGVGDNYGFGSPHNNDINGIGEFNSSCTTTKEFTKAQSSIVTVFDATSLDLGDSLTFAHNNLGFGLEEDVPNGYENRTNQSWRVDKDNNPGNVSISFDLSGTGIPVTLSSGFALLTDTDTNFTDAQIHTTGYTVSGNIINFTTINFTHANYFTLAVTQKAPEVQFVNQTPANNTNHSQNTIEINMTSSAFGDDHYSFVNFDNSLLLWLRMDDINGTGEPVDASGNGNDGTLQGGAFINGTGRFGKAAHFDGDGDYINLPASNSLVENTGAWTMSMWFNTKSISPDSLGNRMITIRNASGLSAAAFTLGNNNQLQFFYRNQGGTGITTNITTISTDTWYHYAVTYNGSASFVYVNGSLNATILDTIVGTSSDAARLAASPTGSSQYFNGSIDELLILNHQLTSNEMLSLYNASANQYYTITAPLSVGTHNFTGFAVGKNGKKNQTQTRHITIEVISPAVTALNVTPNVTYNMTEVITIKANITDISGVDTVLANITFPNNTVIQITLSNGIGNTYNNTFTLKNQLIGTYTVNVIANDTAGNTNATEEINITVQNDIPTPSNIQINAGNDITLASAANTTIIGNATITDLNGYNHINNVTGYLFLTTIGVGALDNTTNHYTTSCTDNGDGIGQSVTYNCTFNVTHYITPTDAGSNQSSTNWTFTVVPRDNENTGANNSDVVETNTLLAFDINPSSINFGSLSLGENTTDTNQEINVTNNGNVDLDITLSGTNFSCTQGILPITFLEYQENPFTYGIGTDLLETGIELDLDNRRGYYGNETPLKTTYYGLGSPGSSLGGSCSGTITITGNADPHSD